MKPVIASQTCSCVSFGLSGRVSLRHVHVFNTLFCVTRIQRTKRSKVQLRRQRLKGSSSAGDEPSGPKADNPLTNTVTNKDVQRVLEFAISLIELDLKTNVEAKKDILQFCQKNNSAPPKWLLEIIETSESSDNQKLADLRQALDESRALPESMEYGAALATLSENPSSFALFMQLFAGPTAIGNSMTRWVGAVVFAFAAGFFGAQPYLLWQAPWDDQWQTFALWTAPFVALTALAAVVRKADAKQAVRCLPDEDLIVSSSMAVAYLKLPGRLMFAAISAISAGIVFRGVWLNSIRGTMFTPQPVPVLEPDMAEALLRNSFGSLVPSMPVPGALLLLGAAATAALLEVVYRLPAAIQTNVETDDESLLARMGRFNDGADRPDSPFKSSRTSSTAAWDSTSDKAMAEPFDGASDSALARPVVTMRTYAMADGEDMENATPATFTASVDLGLVVLEYLTAAYLCAETLITQSLWASIGTHTLGILATMYVVQKVDLQPEKAE